MMTGKRRPTNGSSIALGEEKMLVGKHAVEQGRVVVKTRTDTIEEVVRDNVRHHSVSTSSVPVNRMLDEGEPAPLVRTEGDEVIVPILEEVLVVEKHLVLKEEIHIHRTRNDEKVEIPVTLRRQRAVIERLDAEEDGTPVRSTQIKEANT
jgi:stress response protein YsnF